MSDAEELFWDCAPQLYETEGVTESTMFGFRCLRVDGAFLAMPVDNQLWIKLPAERVAAMIEDGSGLVCAPSGKVYREWVGVSTIDEALWLGLFRDAIEFVRPN